MKPVRAGILYFALVFAAGFVLGAARTLLVVPRIGVRAAELAETPVMLLVSWLAARTIVRRLAVPSETRVRLAMGFLGLVLLATAEIALTLPVRGLTFSEYVGSRDPVSRWVYTGSLLVFALIPLFVSRRR